MKYLVVGKDEQFFASAEAITQVVNYKVMPMFEQINKLIADKKILAGGIPVGDRAIVFIIEAESNNQLDEILRGFIMWGQVSWKITALSDFSNRQSIDAKDI